MKKVKKSAHDHKKACAAYEHANEMGVEPIKLVQNHDMMALYNSVVRSFRADDEALRKSWWHGFGCCLLEVAVIVSIWAIYVSHG